jgi:hypothetical protein
VTAGSIAIGTLRALAAPRRAIPLALVLAAMLTSEWLATRSLPSLAVDASLFAAFCLVAPVSWRILRSRAAGQAAYVALGAAIVGALGLALPRALDLPGTYVAEPYSLGVVLVLWLVGGWGLGRDVELEGGYVAERARAERLAIDAERAQILALRAHLDPHFLFNTLNAIAEWCREDPKVAEKATLELAAMLREILDAIREPAWPLEAEIALARRLFDLYEVRDRERYRFVVDVPDPIPDAHVPPMLLLPLVENAITHGPSAGHGGEVVVRVRTGGDGLDVEIRNPGAFTGRREGGEGIAIVERRIALAYGGRARLSLSGGDGATTASLHLPRRPLAEEVIPS